MGLLMRHLLSGVENRHVRSQIVRMCWRTYGRRLRDPTHWRQLLAYLLTVGILTAATFAVLRIVISPDATWLPLFIRTDAFGGAMAIVVGATVAWIVIYRGARSYLPELLVSLGRCPRCGHLPAPDREASCKKCGALIDGGKQTQEAPGK